MAYGAIPNLGDLTEKEQAALFHEHFGKIASIDDQIAILNEERKAAKRIAKNAGFASEDINWALKARKAEKGAERADAFKHRLSIGGRLNLVRTSFRNRSEGEHVCGKGVVTAFNRRTPDAPRPDVADSPGPRPAALYPMPLFRSQRAYLTQLDCYRAYPGRSGG